MTTFSINSFGCKVNQYEHQQISQFLTDAGLKQVKFGDKADIIVIHTCCVTHIASSKSRQGINKAIKTSPNAQVIVSGCLPSAPKPEIANITGQNVHIVSREDNLKSTLEKIIVNRPDSRTPTPSKIKDNMANMGYFDPIKQFANQSRAFLKVQDGCDGYCTYCIIPKIRTNVCSKDKKDVLGEVKALVDSGHSEVVLTGIFLGAYGRDTVRRKKWDKNEPDYLADLVANIAQVNGLKRLRLSSLEPADVTDRVLDVYAEYDNIAPHFHLPLQSGSDNILKKMVRQYRISDFKEVICKINDRMDRPAITTDIIVGFPGETEEDFRQSIEISEFAKFSKIHVFSFSPREGTAAAKMEPKIAHTVIKQRSAELQKVSDNLAEAYRKQFVGKKLDIIIENRKKSIGRCGRYFEVEVQNLPAEIRKNDMISVLLNPDSVTGVVV